MLALTLRSRRGRRHITRSSRNRPDAREKVVPGIAVNPVLCPSPALHEGCRCLGPVKDVFARLPIEIVIAETAIQDVVASASSNVIGAVETGNGVRAGWRLTATGPSA